MSFWLGCCEASWCGWLKSFDTKGLSRTFGCLNPMFFLKDMTVIHPSSYRKVWTNFASQLAQPPWDELQRDVVAPHIPWNKRILYLFFLPDSKEYSKRFLSNTCTWPWDGWTQTCPDNADILYLFALLLGKWILSVIFSQNSNTFCQTRFCELQAAGICQGSKASMPSCLQRVASGGFVNHFSLPSLGLQALWTN